MINDKYVYMSLVNIRAGFIENKSNYAIVVYLLAKTIAIFLHEYTYSFLSSNCGKQTIFTARGIVKQFRQRVVHLGGGR